MIALAPEEQVVNFGAITVPEGYRVIWNENLRRYYGMAPDGTISEATWRRQSALWWCKRHAERGTT